MPIDNAVISSPSERRQKGATSRSVTPIDNAVISSPSERRNFTFCNAYTLLIG